MLYIYIFLYLLYSIVLKFFLKNEKWIYNENGNLFM